MPFTFSGESVDLRNVVIPTDRLRLEALTTKCSEDIFRNFTPDITRYMIPAPPKDIADTESFINDSLLGLRRGDDLTLVISQPDGGHFLGLCGLHGRVRPNEPELGIWLRKAAHGHGYGREAIAALKTWAEKYLEYERLTYPVDRRNIPSCKIPVALGGKVIAEQKKTSMSGIELDVIVYAFDAVLGWRYLDYNVGSGTTLKELTLNGPFVGAIFRW